MEQLLPPAPVMSQNNRRGQRGAAREKHVCSEIHGQGLVPEWEVSVMHEILLVSAPKGSCTAHQRRQLWDSPSHAEPGLADVSSDQSPGLALSSPSTLQLGNVKYWLLRASQTSFSPPTAVKSTQFPLLQKEHMTCVV